MSFLTGNKNLLLHSHITFIHPDVCTHNTKQRLCRPWHTNNSCYTYTVLHIQMCTKVTTNICTYVLLTHPATFIVFTPHVSTYFPDSHKRPSLSLLDILLSSCIICIIIWYENISVRLSFLLTPVNLTINACHKANSLHLIQESSTQHNLLLPSFIRKHREKPSRTTSRFSSIFHLKATRKNLTRNTSWTKPCPVNQTRSDMPHNHESISSTTPQEHGGLSSCHHNHQWH